MIDDWEMHRVKGPFIYYRRRGGGSKIGGSTKNIEGKEGGLLVHMGIKAQEIFKRKIRGSMKNFWISGYFDPSPLR